MANTKYLSEINEPYVRRWLSKKFGKKFEQKEVALKLITGGKHKFDAVSEDKTIIADVKSSVMRPGSNNRRKVGAGTERSAIVDLYYLHFVSAKRKMLVLTDKSFYQHFNKKMARKIPKDVKLVLCELSKKLKNETAKIHFKSHSEIGKNLKS